MRTRSIGKRYLTMLNIDCYSIKRALHKITMPSTKRKEGGACGTAQSGTPDGSDAVEPEVVVWPATYAAKASKRTDLIVQSVVFRPLQKFERAPKRFSDLGVCADYIAFLTRHFNFLWYPCDAPDVHLPPFPR